MGRAQKTGQRQLAVGRLVALTGDSSWCGSVARTVAHTVSLSSIGYARNRLLVPVLEAVCLDTGIVINDGMNKPLTSISAPAKCFVSLATTATSGAVTVVN